MRIQLEDNILLIDNYIQIISIAYDLIILENIKIEGKDLNIVRLNPISLIIKGNITSISIRS